MPIPLKIKETVVLSCTFMNIQINSNKFPSFFIFIQLFCFIKKDSVRLTEHGDVITPLLGGAPRIGLALGPALVKAGPDHWCVSSLKTLVTRSSKTTAQLIMHLGNIECRLEGF